MKTPAETHLLYGYPPRMAMCLACAYTGLSRWTLARDVRAGRLPVAGKRGRSYVFTREALDAYMVGGGTEPVVAKTAKPAMLTPGTTRPSVSTEATIQRLRRIATGGAR